MYEIQWNEAIQKISSFAKLESNWDGYNTGALSKETVNVACKIAEVCKNSQAAFSWVIPTTDATVLMTVFTADGRTLKVEIQDEESIGIAQRRLDGSRSFHDATLHTFSTFL